MNRYGYERIDTIEALNETLDKSEVKPNWIIYPKLESLRKYAGNAFQHFAPVVLVFQDNTLVGGANRENGTIVVYGLQGGLRITDSFDSDEITAINEIIDKNQKMIWCDKNKLVSDMPSVVRYKFGDKQILKVHSWYYNKINNYWHCISESGLGYIDKELEEYE